LKTRKTRYTLAALALSTGLVLTASAAYAQFQQGPPPPPPGAYQNGPGGGWDAPPAEFHDAARRGFHDGIEGARKDFDNHRRPDVNNRDEYRHPHIERALRHDYREGFRRGYDVGVEHLMHGGPGPR
jgi:hypothetical protein